MNGYEVALRLAAEAKGDPPLLIALSGYSAREDRERAKKVGFDQFTDQARGAEGARTAALVGR